MNMPIHSHQLSPPLATPRTVAFIFAGAAGYIGFIDPKVRDSFPQTRQRLRQWAEMYKRSAGVMGSLAILGAALGAMCYMKTKINLWLVGGAVMGSLWPYTYLVLMPTNKILTDLDATLDVNKQITSGDKYKVLKKFKFWVKGHQGGVLISLIAAGIFYLAQLKSTQNVDVSVNLK